MNLTDSREVSQLDERAETSCISKKEETYKSRILAEFLRKNRAEAVKVSIYEYNEEKHMRQEREAGREEGRKTGIEEGRKQGIKEGIKEGQRKGRLEMICHALKNGAASEQLKELLGATEEELEAAGRMMTTK